MDNRIKNGIALALIPQIVLVKWLGSYPELIETYYSKGLYPLISRFFRILFGWIPFSMGDIVYTLLLFLALRYLFMRRSQIKNNLRSFGRDVAVGPIRSLLYLSLALGDSITTGNPF